MTLEPQDRYARQARFAPIGVEGQRRIREARVLLVGCGALGSALAELVVRAGVGALTVVDRDLVDESNLQRQMLFDEEDARLGRAKASAAEARLRRLNSDVLVRGLVRDVTARNVDELLGGVDLVLDGTDNLDTRLLLNDASLRLGVPWVYGGCVGSHGLVMAVRPGVTPCLRCVLGERPAAGTLPTCETAGVIGPAVSVVAGLQAAEAFKLLAGRPEALLPGLVVVDVWSGEFEVIDQAGRAPSCPACTRGVFEASASAEAVELCGRDSVQLPAPSGRAVDLTALGRRLAAVGDVVANEHLVRFRSASSEIVVFADGRAIVRGVRSAAEARSVYARHVGA